MADDLLVAVRIGQPDIVKALIEAGADVSAIGGLDEAWWTPLGLAALRGRADLVRILVEAGADVTVASVAPRDCGTEAEHEANSAPALAFALARGHRAVVRYLTARCSPNTRKRARQCVAEWCSHGSRNPSFDFLCDSIDAFDVHDVRQALAGTVDLNARDPDGNSALHRAARFEGRAEIVRLLIEAGASVNARNASDETPLHQAAGRRCSEYVALLLESGADPNARDRFGQTPLFLSDADQPTIRLLLAAGADVNARDADGQTPLLVIGGWCSAETIALLLAHGADPSAVDGHGKGVADRPFCTEPREVLRRVLELRRGRPP
jgi:ankyrin repeat protein